MKKISGGRASLPASLSIGCKRRAQRPALQAALVLALLIFPSFANAAPQIKQFFPSTDLVLGQPLFWIIELRYPLWESYRLQIQPCKGAEITLAEEKLEEANAQIRALYRLRIVPENLVIADTPSVLITDSKGQSTVLQGKAIRIQSISGNSVEVKDPLAVVFGDKPVKNILPDVMLFLAVSTLTGMLIWKFYFAGTPRRILQQRFKKIETIFRRDHQLDVPEFCTLLRSDLLWGQSVHAKTGLELADIAKEDEKLGLIASAIQALEWVRYSQESVRWDWKAIQKSIRTALDLLSHPKTKSESR